MILYTGGKYQGKLNIAMQDNGLLTDDVFDFSCDETCDFSDKKIQADSDFAKKKIWYEVDSYIRRMAFTGLSIEDMTEKCIKLIDGFCPEIVIINEVGAGVIPMDKTENNFREAVGRVSVYAANKSEKVYRVVCGIRTEIK